MPAWRGFIGGSQVAQSIIGDAEDTINLYVERLPQSGTNVAALFPSPGFQQWASVHDVGGRALAFPNKRLFAVMGQGVYEFDINGTPTKWGTVAIDGNPAQIAFNGKVGGQLGIVSGGNVYSFDLGTNTLLPTTRIGGYTHLAFAGGFGLAFQGTTGKVFLSALNDFTTWDDGTFFQRSLFGDPWQAMFVDENNLIWMLGTETFEVWYNTGTGTQPWAPLSGLVGLYGIAAPFAFGLSAVGNAWVMRNPQGTGQMILSKGSSPQPVSSYAFDTAVAAYLRTGQIADAELLVYQQEGHTFACPSFPTPAKSWAYDIEGQDWTKRGRWNPNKGDYDLWSPRVHTLAFGKHLVADRTTGIIAEMDTNIATELDGTGIRRQRVAPGLVDDLKRIPIDQIELLMDVGLGVQVGQGMDPTVTLEVSQNGGRSYGNELRCGVGRAGEYRKRVYWSRLGAAADTVFRVTFSDPIPFRIINAFVNGAETGQRAA